MNKTHDAWKSHLIMIGENAYESATENPDKTGTQALLEAVATMISENDRAHQGV